MVFSIRRMAHKLRVTQCGEEIHRTGPGDELGSQASRRARLTTTLPAFHARLLSGLSDMSDANARSDGNSGTGVLELLRLFKGDAAAADQYAITQLGKTRTVEPVLKAFEYLPLDVARKPGPLSGIPVGIKDIIATANMPTTNGSPIYRDHVPGADAWIVERLRNLGATIFGKTVSTEFAWRHPGPTVNPWNQKHTPGGSSSGSAAAVAAGIVPLALGTQTLGSIIRPAAFNGVVSDSDIHGRPVPAFQVSIEQGLSPLAAPRLAIVRFAKWSKAEPEQQQLFDAAVVKSRDAGATLEERELPELDRTNWSTINTILASEAALIFGDLVERYPDRTSNHLKDLVRTGKAHTAYDYLAAKALQEELRSAVSSQLSGFDAVLTLPAFGAAPEGLGYTGDAQYCAPWTLLGTPAVSLPAGFGKNGLPLGLQIVGAYRQDHRALRVAKWIESVLKFDPGIPRVHPAET